MSYEEKKKAVQKAHPMWSLGTVYRFDKFSNFLTFEQWIEKKYEELKND